MTDRTQGNLPAKTAAWLSGLFLYFLGMFLMPIAVRAGEAVIGINMVNPQRLSAAEQNAMLAQMKSAGVRVIRCGITDDDKGLDFAKRVYAQRMKIEWIVPLQYRPDAPTRAYQPDKFPLGFGGHPLSSADPEVFRAYFQSFLAKLEAQGIVLAGFELGNEINWAPFNAEFRLPGEGKNLSLHDLYSDPEGQRIAKGYLQYLKLLAVLKDVRDRSKLNAHTPIISAGLADDGPPGLRPHAKMDGVSLNDTLDFLRSHGLDNLVDAYGIHTYPRETTHARRLNSLEENAVTQCGTLQTGGKPCWITEWGIANHDISCPPNETQRSAIVQDMMSDFRNLQAQGRLIGLNYYSWNSDPWAKHVEPMSVFRCGRLTESGRLAI